VYLIVVVQVTASTSGVDVVITTSLVAAISTTFSNALAEQFGTMTSNDATLRLHQRVLSARLQPLRRQELTFVPATRVVMAPRVLLMVLDTPVRVYRATREQTASQLSTTA